MDFIYLCTHEKDYYQRDMNKIYTLLLIGIALILMQGCGSSTKEADLPVRKSCNLERLYKDMPRDIRTDTPDLAFVNALCAGNSDEVVALFREKKLFWDESPAVDAPYGRFEGLDDIHSFAKGFLARFNATSATFEKRPIPSTWWMNSMAAVA
jgi:hypothetical protein